MQLPSLVGMLSLCFCWIIPASGIGSERFTQLTDCICPGYLLELECTTVGIGSTIWNGTGLDCPPSNAIVLRHSQFENENGTTGSCNGGTILGYSIRKVDDEYTSRLNISTTHDLDNKTIICKHNDLIDIHVVGEITVNTTIVEQPPPSPTNVTLRNLSKYYLYFTWNLIPRACPAILYLINATNCGICPHNTTSSHVVCFISVTAERKDCTFIVQTSLCSVKGMASDVLEVSLKVLEAPTSVKLNGGYGDDRKLMKITTEFSEVKPNEISHGIDNSIYNYTIELYSVGTMICDSVNISAFFCKEDKCKYEFLISKNSYCLNSTSISMVVFASNILGAGKPSEPKTVRTMLMSNNGNSPLRIILGVTVPTFVVAVVVLVMFIAVVLWKKQAKLHLAIQQKDEEIQHKIEELQQKEAKINEMKKESADKSSKPWYRAWKSVSSDPRKQK